MTKQLLIFKRDEKELKNKRKFGKETICTSDEIKVDLGQNAVMINGVIFQPNSVDRMVIYAQNVSEDDTFKEIDTIVELRKNDKYIARVRIEDDLKVIEENKYVIIETIK